MRLSAAGEFLEQMGFGTERIEAEIRALFPDARVARVDRDTVRRKGAITGLLSRFAAGEIDILVGTQMIAKGHDFPRVTLVGVISADVGLGMADFRAGERTFQLLTQVAGRSGRGELRGRGLRPDALPDPLQHPSRLPAGLRRLLRRRDRVPQGDEVSAGVAMINAVVKAPTREGAMADAADLVRAHAVGRRAVPRARPGAGAAEPAERGAPRAVLHQGNAPRRDAEGARRRAGRPARDPAPDDRRRRPDVGSMSRST